jgi:hypothetical protein
MLVACLDVGCLVIGAGAGYTYAQLTAPEVTPTEQSMRDTNDQAWSALVAERDNYRMDRNDFARSLLACREASRPEIRKESECCVNLARVNRRYDEMVKSKCP